MAQERSSAGRGAPRGRCPRRVHRTAAAHTARASAADFTVSRSGEHARRFLGTGTDHAWRGSLVCDDFSGYKALFAQGLTEAGCMAHARRQLVELHIADKSDIAATAIEFIGQLYGIEREVKALRPEQRGHERRTRAAPIAAALHGGLAAQRAKVTDAGATAMAINYSSNR